MESAERLAQGPHDVQACQWTAWWGRVCASMRRAVPPSCVPRCHTVLSYVSGMPHCPSLLLQDVVRSLSSASGCCMIPLFCFRMP